MYCRAIGSTTRTGCLKNCVEKAVPKVLHLLGALKGAWVVALGVLLDVSSLGNLASCLGSLFRFFFLRMLSFSSGP